MNFIETSITGVYYIEPESFFDERGSFTRFFCQNIFGEIGFTKQIVQINHSVTKKKGTIRGMHYQLPPASEIKLIKCIKGCVFDVFVDLRQNSPTFMQWEGIELTEDHLRMVYIPEGMAHGFQSLSENTELIYHHCAYYTPEFERGLRFDDPALSIEWPLAPESVSSKDQSYRLIDSHFSGIII